MSIPQEGLVANITLDGNAFDEVNNLTGVNHNVFAIADHHGTANHAMYFNPVDSAYLDFGDAPMYSFPENIFTISCWVIVTDTFNPIAILSKRNATGPFEYSWDDHMSMSFFSFDNWLPDGSTTVFGIDPLKAMIPISIDQWQHITVVANGVILKTYLNGTQVGGIDSLRSGHTFTDTSAPFQIGVGGGYGKHYYFNGAIDDLLIYNRVLTPQEVGILSKL